MSWDYVPGKNAEGYPDPTAAAALSNVQRSQRGLQSKRAGEHFENMIAASLGWYKDKGVAFIEKTPEPMRPLRPPNRQGQFLACYIKAGQPDFKGTLTGGRAVVFEAKHTDSDRIDYNRLTQEQLNSLAEHDRERDRRHSVRQGAAGKPQRRGPDPNQSAGGWTDKKRRKA